MKHSMAGPSRGRVATVESQGVCVSGTVTPQLRAEAIDLAERSNTSLSRIVAKALELYVKEPS